MAGTDSSSAKPDRRTAVRAILLAGFAAGLIDFLYASWQRMSGGGSPLDPWKGVASGLLGPEAREGGIGMVLLGTALHFFICFVAAALLYLILRRVPWLVRQPLIAGILYGIGFLIVMNYVILPLSRIGRSIYPLDGIHVTAFWHVVLVGIPTAWVLSRFMRADRPAAANA